MWQQITTLTGAPSSHADHLADVAVAKLTISLYLALSHGNPLRASLPFAFLPPVLSHRRAPSPSRNRESQNASPTSLTHGFSRFVTERVLPSHNRESRSLSCPVLQVYLVSCNLLNSVAGHNVQNSHHCRNPELTVTRAISEKPLLLCSFLVLSLISRALFLLAVKSSLLMVLLACCYSCKLQV
ncbi:hypothetical protein PIB30_019619 [Stylosanthes scabra]|uniref:Uncharacterized protein n=1 Tax=Stylosanthes scabra TaxID=79078 RepID=A0ABU6R8J0_9FABA|nr:hypothetical protein [Stylosanthes scabra]